MGSIAATFNLGLTLRDPETGEAEDDPPKVPTIAELESTVEQAVASATGHKVNATATRTDE